MCLGSCNLLICRFLCPSSILAGYLSVVPDIRPFRPTPSLLSTTPELVLPWQWDLCAPSLKRDPHRFRFIIDREDFFPAELIWEDFLCTFLWLAPHDPVMRHYSSCIVQPTFLVLIGFPILLQLVLLFPPRRVDLPIPPTEKKKGQTVLLLLQFSWHYWSAAVLVILPTLVIFIQLHPTLLFS
jgi:hypothetical protein